jgi:hypothetical protein
VVHLGAPLSASEKEIALVQNDSSLAAERKKQYTDLAQKRIAAMSKH